MTYKGHIEARRWIDSYGNTYHSVTLHAIERIGTTPASVTRCLVQCSYGFGNAWEDSAREALGLARYMREGKSLAQYGYTASVIDVARKADL